MGTRTHCLVIVILDVKLNCSFTIFVYLTFPEFLCGNFLSEPFVSIVAGAFSHCLVECLCKLDQGGTIERKALQKRDCLGL